MDNQEQLVAAAKEGNLNEVVRLIPLTNPQRDYSEALGQAARYGHLDCVQALIPVSDPTSDNSFSLWIAACQGHVDCVTTLIAVSNVKDGACRALNIAVRNGHTDCVRVLLPHYTPKERVRAIPKALLGEHEECLKLLVDGLKDRSVLIPYFHQSLDENKWNLADVFYNVMPVNLTSPFASDFHLYPDYYAHKQKLVLEQHVHSANVRTVRKL